MAVEDTSDEKDLTVAAPIDDTSNALALAQPALSRTKLFLIASAPCAVWFAGVMQICGVNFIIPVIQDKLHSSDGQVQWVSAAFNITWASFALVAGRLSDIYGIRKSFIFGLSFYFVFTGASAFMPNLESLSTARGLAGIGFAIGSPCGSALIGTFIPPGRPRTLAFAAMSGSGATGAGFGFILGGVFQEWKELGWRVLPFAASLPIVYAVIIGIYVVPQDQPHPTDKRVDWLGAFIITACQLCLMLSLTLSVSQSKGWAAPYVPTLLVVSLLAFGLFVWRQLYLDKRESIGRHPPPLTPRRLFTRGRGQLVPIYFSAVLIYMQVDSLHVLAAYLYTHVMRLNGLQAGLRIAPATFSGIAAALFVAAMCTRMPARALLILVDFLGGMSGIFFGAKTGIYAPYWQADLWAWLCNGWAADGTLAIASAVISHVTPPGDHAVANAILASCSRFGAALGFALVTIVREAVAETERRAMLDKTAHSSLSPGEAALECPQEQQAMWIGLRAAMFFTGACSFSAAVLIAVFMKGWLVLGNEGKQASEGAVASERANELEMESEQAVVVPALGSQADVEARQADLIQK